MNDLFEQYLAISPTGRKEYLKFMVALADIAIENEKNPQIAPETVKKAYWVREHATKELEKERRTHFGEQIPTNHRTI